MVISGSQSFPRLFESVKQTLFAPESTAGIGRIFIVAGYTLSKRRNRTSDENVENQLFANVNFKWCPKKIEIKLETSDKERERENFEERERKSAEDFRLQSGARKVKSGTSLV